MSRIAIIGAGAWGTGLAIVLGRKGNHSVRLWANETEVCESITTRRVNERFLPGFTLPDTVQATHDIHSALEGAEIVVSVMPSQHCRALFERMAPSLRPEILFVSCTKGLEEGTLLRMTEVIGDVLRARAFLQGGRAEWAVIRKGGGAWRSHGRDRSFDRHRLDSHRAARFQ